MSVTPQLYYKLCVIEGACLAVGLGIPFLLHPFTHTNESGLPELVSFVMTFFGTWGLLTAGTGLVFLRSLREHLAIATAPAKLYSADGDRPASASSSKSEATDNSRPVLTLHRDEDEDEVTTPSHSWKAQWRGRNGSPDGKSPAAKTGSK